MSSTLRDSRRVIVLQHAASENLGTIEGALTACGVAFEYVRSFEGSRFRAAWTEHPA
jgi:hypothetical protein